MAFGKNNEPQRRHRPKREAEVPDEDEARQEREDKLNSQAIPKVMTLLASVALLGIAVLAAPYTYATGEARYTKPQILEAERLAAGSKSDRLGADEHLILDFERIVLPVRNETGAAQRVVAEKCRPNLRAISVVTPTKIHKAFDVATSYLTCSMATEVTRFCNPAERAVLVDQLIAYADRRQNVLAFEAYRTKAIAKHELYRETMRKQGASVPPPLTFPKVSLPEGMDPGVMRSLAKLVKLGYIGPQDFGAMGFYIPRDYAPSLTVGAERYAYCPGKA